MSKTPPSVRDEEEYQPTPNAPFKFDGAKDGTLLNRPKNLEQILTDEKINAAWGSVTGISDAAKRGKANLRLATARQFLEADPIMADTTDERAARIPRLCDNLETLIQYEKSGQASKAALDIITRYGEDTQKLAWMIKEACVGFGGVSQTYGQEVGQFLTHLSQADEAQVAGANERYRVDSRKDTGVARAAQDYNQSVGKNREATI